MAFNFRLLALISCHPLLSSAQYNIRCGPINTTTFSRAFKLIRNLAANFVHDTCTERFDGNRIQVAAWPMYASVSDDDASFATIQVSGYAYGLSDCASRWLPRRMALRNLFDLVGGNISHYSGASINEAWLSHSVSGADISLETSSNITNLQHVTGRYGHFDATVPIRVSIKPSTQAIPTAEVRIRASGCGDSLRSANFQTSAFLVPERGLTIVSDVDDILRTCELWNWKRALLSFSVVPFVPWLNMNEIYMEWQRLIPQTHFHYTTDALETMHEWYTEGAAFYYPVGTFDFRPMIFDSLTQVLNPRYNNIKRLIKSFPKRKFVLLGDTSTGSTLSAYVQLAKEFEQVQCIIIRDVSSIEPSDWIVPNLKALRQLKGRYALFQTPSELQNLTTSLQRLSRGKEKVGCGTVVDTDTKTHGSFVSWILTLMNGAGNYFQCFNLMSHRPHMACPFDRREGTWYTHGGYEPQHIGEVVRGVHNLSWYKNISISVDGLSYTKEVALPDCDLDKAREQGPWRLCEKIRQFPVLAGE